MSRLIAQQHLLPSLQWLFDEFIRRKSFSEIQMVVKDYSAIASVRKMLPTSVSIQKSPADCFRETGTGDVLLLDEGGGLHEAMPPNWSPRSAGLEQTTFGLSDAWKCPMVLVCRSAAKLVFESQIIARSILRKLESLDLISGATIGIIGLGALGSELARTLRRRNIPTLGTDIRQSDGTLASIAVQKDELLRRSDLILGCTGTDVLQIADLAAISGRKVFASCSSNNIEFRTILNALAAKPTFSTVSGNVGDAHCQILNGGFPINFDRVREWEMLEEIVLTRQLVLEGLLQAHQLIGSPPRGVMLDPRTQLRVVTEWLNRVPEPDTIRIPGVLTENFFRENSEGEPA